ncbi:MAG TPA: hypothetical protein VFK80_05565, partial [Limnochordia bacterium]|nr:hypothetical protein [Limnochordia bacterium]
TWLDSGAVFETGAQGDDGRPITAFTGLGSPARSIEFLGQGAHWLYAKTSLDPATGQSIPNPQQWVPVVVPHPPGSGPNPVPIRVVGWMLTSAIPTNEIPYALDFIAWLVRHGDAGYRSSGFLPPIPQDGLRIFGDDARFYYQQMANARIMSSVDSAVWERFNRNLGLFYDGKLTAQAFAQLVDTGSAGG